MSPVLVQGTVFANAYYLQKLVNNQSEDGSQLWEAYSSSKKLDVFLLVAPAASPPVAKTFRENLARYQTISNDHLISLIDYNVDLNNLPYLVTKACDSVTLRSSPAIESDEALANLLSQLSNALLSLHNEQLSPQALTVDTVYFNNNQYWLQPVIKTMNGNGFSDLQALGKLCQEVAPKAPALEQFVSWIKPDTTVAQLNTIATNFTYNKVWAWEPSISTPPDSGPEIPPTPPPPPPPPSYRKFLLIIGSTLVALLGYMLWSKERIVQPTSDPSLAYKALLDKGQQFVQTSAKDSAIIAFKEAVRIQKKNNLPESDEAKRLYKLYLNSADEQFALADDPAMYSMMSTPKDYYELSAALKDSPELRTKIKTCERLLGKN